MEVMMSKEGHSEKISPVTVLYAIDAKKGDALWGNDQNNAGQRARVFNDVLKEESNKIKADPMFVERFVDLIKGFQPPPVTEDVIAKIEKEFEHFKKELTSDPLWETFWEKIRDQKKPLTDEPQFTEEDIKAFQTDVINGYRMKMFSQGQLAYETNLNEQMNEARKAGNQSKLDSLEKESGKAQLFKDLILKVNIASREKKENQTTNDFLQQYYRDGVGAGIMAKATPNDLIIEIAKKAQENSMSETELKSYIEKKLDAHFNSIMATPVGSPNRVPYFQLYDKQSARQIYDELLPVDAILNKVKGYQIASVLGVVPNPEGQTSIDQSAFFPTTKPTNEGMKISGSQRHSTLQSDQMNAKNAQGETPLEVALNTGNLAVISDLVKAGADPNAKSNNYKRGFLTRLGDTVKGLFGGQGMKAWNSPPERSINEIIHLSGNKDVLQAVNRAEQERKVINQEVDPKIIKSLDDSLPPQISSSNANLLSSPPPFTQLKDQIDQQLPPNATPLQAFQHDVGMMLSQIKKEIESVEKDDPFSAKMLKIDAKQLESIREVLASPQTDTTTLIGKIDDIVIKAEGERKAANNNLAPVHSKTTMNMLNMVEKHQGKMSVPVEPEKEVIARRSPTAKNS